MRDGFVPCDEQFGDQPPVTACPERFSAHEARRGLRELSRQRLLPFIGAHASRVAPEGRDPDAAEALLTRLAAEPAAELHRVPVVDPYFTQRLRERSLPELRIPPGARKPPHVHERLDIYFA
jgi:hypothetical protein